MRVPMWLLAVAISVAVGSTIWAWLARTWLRGWSLSARRRALLAFVGLYLVGPLAQIAQVFGGAVFFEGVQGTTDLLMVTLLLSAGPIALLVLWLWRADRSERTRLGAHDRSVPSRREAIARVGGTVTLAAAGSATALGCLRTRFDVECVTVALPVPRLPRELEGYTLVQVSDVHVGAFIGESELRHVEQLVAGLRPDLVVMTGDLVHMHASSLPGACAWLRRVGATARDGLVSIVGNHEYYVGVESCVSAMRAAGLRVLRNEALRLRPRDGGGLVLAGLDDLQGRRSGAGPGPLWSSLDGLPGDVGRVVLCHNPSVFRDEEGDFDVMLSGHTHGGQVFPLGTLATRVMLGASAGLYRKGAQTLYVNRGIGTSGPPTRVGVRPEITRVVLVRSV